MLQEEIIRKYKAAQFEADDGNLKELDLCMKANIDDVNSEINKACFPDGMLKVFPDNNLQLMVQSGAKGSMVSMRLKCWYGFWKFRN